MEFVPGNRIRLLENGAGFFPALVEAIDGAREEVHLETYIFADDIMGQAVAAALIGAAGRGVAVRVLVDGFGTPNFLEGLGRAMIAGGVQVMIYRPELGRLRFRRHRLRRLHRKLAVVDGSLGFVGGINVVDDWDNLDRAAQVPPRYDYAVALEGPLVGQVHRAVHHLWRLVRWSQIGRRMPAISSDGYVPPPAGNASCAFVIRDNLRHRRDIEDAYLEAITSAREEILLANAYFLPGLRFRHALMDAARRGVRVIVLVQGRVEYVLQHFATRSLYRKLVEAGVQIHEYHRSFLHAKVAVIDGRWATVGSSNIDPFSLLLAREANVIAADRLFATALRNSLEKAIQTGATAVDASKLEQQSWWQRLGGSIAYFLVRMAVGMTHYGGVDYRE